jgi:DNA polymerase-1
MPRAQLAGREQRARGPSRTSGDGAWAAPSVANICGRIRRLKPTPHGTGSPERQHAMLCVMATKNEHATAGPDLRGKTVWAIDTLSRVYQLFHALPEMSAPDGRPVSAVYGLTRDLLDIVEKKKPDYLLCAMDAPGPTFRHEQFEAYKATRAEMPADLVPQIPLVRRLFEVMEIPCLELAGYEADDLLATVAEQTVQRGGECVLATADKDARQLIGEQVRLLNLRTNALIGAEELHGEWGLRPDQVVDYLALVGDAVDNVPGIPGVGPKTASELLVKFGTLDNLLEHIDEVSGKKRKENLATHADTARAGRELIRLERAVPVEIPWEAARLHPPAAEQLAEFLREMGFKSIVGKVLAGQPAVTPTAKPAKQATPARGGQQAFLDLGDDGDEQLMPGRSSPPAVTVGDTVAELSVEHEIAAFVKEARKTGLLAISFVVAADARPTTPPLGVVLAAGGRTVFIGHDCLVKSVAVRAALADPGLPKIAHDMKRQWVAARVAGLDLVGGVFDTLLAGYLLDAGERVMGPADIARRNGLAIHLSLSSAGTPFDTATLERPTDAVAAAVVCQVVQQLHEPLAARLRENGLDDLFANVELPLATLLGAMEVRGVRVDTAALATLSRVYTDTLSRLEREIHELAGHELLVTSPVQVRTVLFEELKLPVVKRTKTGPSTDAEVLEELAQLHPLPAKLLEHRKFAKLKSTYVDALPLLVDPATGRIHTSFNQTVTATGRLSSSEPNLQNIPTRSAEGQQIRAAFLPREPGWRFLSADYSQIELRILAHLSGDAAMREAFATGEDIHTRTAAAVYGVAGDEVTAEMRRAAKAVNFGILYGQSAFGLAKGLGIPQPEAAAFIAAYFKTFAGAETFMDEVLDRCRRNGYITTMLGRRRAISGVRDRAGRRSAAGGFALSLPERTAVNTIVQGSAADLIKLAMLRVDRRVKAEVPEAAIVLQIHDELLLEAPAAAVDPLAQIVPEEMRVAMQLDVPLEVSVHTGVTWADCEKG